MGYEADYYCDAGMAMEMDNDDLFIAGGSFDGASHSYARMSDKSDAIRKNMHNGEWMLKDGSMLKIKDMTTAHILNCMSMFKKRDSLISKGYHELFESELSKRSEDHE